MDFYAWRAEAFIQLCDFSSAAQNLRRACSFQPENPKYLERLAFVLYIQVLHLTAQLPSPCCCGGLSLLLPPALSLWEFLVPVSVSPPIASLT